MLLAATEQTQTVPTRLGALLAAKRHAANDPRVTGSSDITYAYANASIVYMYTKGSAFLAPCPDLSHTTLIVSTKTELILHLTDYPLTKSISGSRAGGKRAQRYI